MQSSRRQKFRYRFGNHILQTERPLVSISESIEPDSYSTIFITEISHDAVTTISRGQLVWIDSNASFSVWLSDGAYFIQFDELAGFELLLEQSTIRIHRPHETMDETIEHLLLDQVLPRFLSKTGEIVLHASAIAQNGLSVAFLGESGAGKSTLSASFAGEATLLTDDALVTMCSGTSAEVIPTYPTLRLCTASIQGLFENPPSTMQMAQYSTKRRLTSKSHVPTVHGTFELACCFLINRNPAGSNVSIESIGQKQACMTFVKSMFQLDPTNRTTMEHTLNSAIKLSELVPVYLLNYPHEFDRLSQVREAVKDCLGKRASHYGTQR
ncbi:hypothetical protein AAFN47_04150 [Hoeflea sp. CAU 1731]